MKRYIEFDEYRLKERGFRDYIYKELLYAGFEPGMTLHEEKRWDSAKVIYWWNENENKDVITYSSSDQETTFDINKIKEAINLLKDIHIDKEFISEEDRIKLNAIYEKYEFISEQEFLV
jgi:hypothetical protein